MPVCATASAIADVFSFAASYLMRQALAEDVGVERLEAGQGFSRCSRIATSSWQSMPSILKTDSAWTSHTVAGGSHQRALLGHVRARPCWSRLEDVLIVERVVDAAALRGAPRTRRMRAHAAAAGATRRTR